MLLLLRLTLTPLLSLLLLLLLLLQQPCIIGLEPLIQLRRHQQGEPRDLRQDQREDPRRGLDRHQVLGRRPERAQDRVAQSERHSREEGRRLAEARVRQRAVLRARHGRVHVDRARLRAQLPQLGALRQRAAGLRVRVPDPGQGRPPADRAAAVRRQGQRLDQGVRPLRPQAHRRQVLGAREHARVLPRPQPVRRGGLHFGARRRRIRRDARDARPHTLS